MAYFGHFAIVSIYIYISWWSYTEFCLYIGSCQVFENLRFLRKVSDFSTIFFGWVLHRGGQGPGKGPNIYIYVR